MNTPSPNQSRDPGWNNTFELETLEAAANYHRAIVGEFAPFVGGNVLEIGAGIGRITELLAPLAGVEQVVAVEPQPDFCRRFQARLPGQPLIQGTAQAVPSGRLWHAIVSVNVLEHIQDDAAELRRYHELLAPARGHLCLFVPARQELFAPIDADFGHHRRYARPQLASLLRQAGFGDLRLHYYNLAGYAAWWFYFCLLRRHAFTPSIVRFFDRFIFPPAHWLEANLCRPPLGQSLLAIARPALK